MRRPLTTSALGLSLAMGLACGWRPESRGEVSSSPNGKTYGVVDDDNGGGFGPGSPLAWTRTDGAPRARPSHMPGSLQGN